MSYHWIQYRILVELTRHATRRYSQLRPADVDGNLFTYHLNGLLRDGLIEKYDRIYQLSTKGLQFVGALSLDTGRTRTQPKILNAIICRNSAGEYLFTKWHRQPNVGLISFPHGMMHYGASAVDMAIRELAEKSGLEADMVFRGSVYVRGMRGDKVDRHMLVHLFEAHNARPDPQSLMRHELGEAFWANLDTIPAERFVPGFYEIAKLVDEQPKGHTFADIVVDIPKPGPPKA